MYPEGTNVYTSPLSFEQEGRQLLIVTTARGEVVTLGYVSRIFEELFMPDTLPLLITKPSFGMSYSVAFVLLYLKSFIL